MPNGTGGFIRPEEVLKELNIKEGATVADFGCGHGYFAVPLAKLAGKEGKLFALDVQKSALEQVESRAKLEGAANIQTIRCNLELPNGSTLQEQSADLVILANILFQSQKKAEIVAEAGRVLKSGGKLVIIDWRPQGVLAPKTGWLMNSEEAKNLAQTQGFKLEKEFQAGDYHYGLVFSK